MCEMKKRVTILQYNLKIIILLWSSPFAFAAKEEAEVLSQPTSQIGERRLVSSPCSIS